MENYRKGKNVEEPLEKSNIPIPNLPDDFLWMHVRGGSKIRNLLSHALKEFKDTNVIVWTGFGQSVGKTITCAEIMKKETGNTLHQITKISYRKVEEYWDPLISDMDQLVVKRKLPLVHIALSKIPFHSGELGNEEIQSDDLSQLDLEIDFKEELEDEIELNKDFKYQGNFQQVVHPNANITSLFSNPSTSHLTVCGEFVSSENILYNPSFPNMVPSDSASSNKLSLLSQFAFTKKEALSPQNTRKKSGIDLHTNELIISPPAKQRRKRNRFPDMTQDDVEKLLLPDHIAPELDILIIGINPGLFSAYKGHHYANPGNHFWKCLYLSGFTPNQMNAYQDFQLLDMGIGFTNMVERTTKGSNDLSRKELKEGSKSLLVKLQMYKPKIAVFNGKQIYEVFSGKKKFMFGKQQELIDGTGTYIWVMPSTSARFALLPRAEDKVPYFAALKKFRDSLNGTHSKLDDSELVFDLIKSKKSKP